jgi:FeS assembly protein IscX
MSDESGYNRLYWDSSLGIIQELTALYPNVDVESVGLEQLRQWIVTLPNFVDDPELVNDGILNDILREWYEEVTS